MLSLERPYQCTQFDDSSFIRSIKRYDSNPKTLKRILTLTKPLSGNLLPSTYLPNLKSLSPPVTKISKAAQNVSTFFCDIVRYWWKYANFHLATTFEFPRYHWHQKTRVHGLSCGIVSVIPSLPTLAQYRLVSDTVTQHILCYHSIAL